MTEEWRPVVGNDNYMISSHGRVYSHLSQKFLRPGIASNGYPTVVLGGSGYPRGTRTCHSLVADAFIGPRPDGKEVAHEDGNRQNPCLENLSYKTPSENLDDRIKHGTWSPEKSSEHGRRISEIRLAKDPDCFLKSNRKGLETKILRYGEEWSAMSFAGIKYAKQELDL